VATLILAGFVGFDTANGGTGGVIIDNGTIQLGVWNEGHLNVPGGTTSLGGTTEVGLRYLPTNAEATAPGCLCEGWGAGDNLTSKAGYANEDSCDNPVTNLVVESFTSTESTAISVVRVVSGEQDIYRVTHSYFPSPITPFLYQVDVTIENISAAPTEVLYRRVMDWDIEPTEFDEYVTINAFAAGNLVRTSTDGFACSNPFDAPSSSPPSFVPGPVTDLGFGTGGPFDNGALFDFNFGTLAPGASKTFTTFYGAAGTEVDAIAALVAAGAEIFSFGQPSTTDGPTLGTPNTFIFAFAGVGAPPAFHTPKTGEIIASQDGMRRMHFNTTYQDEFGNGHITEAKLKIVRPIVLPDGVAPLAKPKLAETPFEVTLTYDVVNNELRMEENIIGAVPELVGVCNPGRGKTVTGKMLKLNCAKTNVVGNENTLKVQWSVVANTKFKGPKDLFLFAKDVGNGTDGFNKAGTWFSDKK